MNAPFGVIRAGVSAAALTAAILIALPLSVMAQSDPALSSNSTSTDTAAMSGMDNAGMHGTPAAVDSHAHNGGKSPAPMKDGDHAAMDHAAMDHAAMSGMDHSGMDHGSMGSMTDGSPATDDSTSGMNMDAMQGGSAPPGARSPDYSDGIGYGSLKSHLHGNDAVGMLVVDQLEAVHGRDGNAQAWEIEGWYGNDLDKLWLRSEGEVSQGKVEDGNIEMLWNHAIAAYWGSQLGIRHDFGAGPSRDWVAFGVEGLAPYWFELEATGYVGTSGRTAARVRADYELLLTQRLILQPELELNLYGQDDPARGIGSGLSDVQFGLRLRYEVRREFAPYVGINWVRRVGSSADYARADGQSDFDQQLVAGFRFWF